MATPHEGIENPDPWDEVEKVDIIPRRIQRLIDKGGTDETKEYQDWLRAQLKTEPDLLFYLTKLLEKRRLRRDQEKQIIEGLRSATLTNKELLLASQYILADELEWFDVFRIPNDACVLELGRRDAGKTFGSKYLCYTKRKVFPFVYVFTRTPFNGSWKKNISPDCVFDGWDEDAVTQFKEYQAKARESPEWGVDPRALVILDDMAADPKLRWNKQLLEFSFYGRHLVVMIIITSQWYKQLAPGFRDNCDFIFVYKMDNDNEIEALWKEHGSGVHKRVFRALVHKYSTNTTALVINKNGSTPLRKFFQWRALDPGPFRMGCKSVWEGK